MNSEYKERMENFIDSVLDVFAQYPEKAQVNFIEATDSTVIEIIPHPEDAGVMIGKMGRTATALRDLAASASNRLRHSISIRIITPSRASKSYEEQKRGRRVVNEPEPEQESPSQPKEVSA